MQALPLNEWIELLGEFYNQYGYLTVFLGTLGENTALLGLLLPGNSLALLGAMYARLGTLNLGLVIFLATLGTVLGYHLATEIDRLQMLIERVGWVLFGVLVLLFLAWRFFGQRIRLRLRKERRDSRRRARSAVLQ